MALLYKPTILQQNLLILKNEVDKANQTLYYGSNGMGLGEELKGVALKKYTLLQNKLAEIKEILDDFVEEEVYIKQANEEKQFRRVVYGK